MRDTGNTGFVDGCIATGCISIALFVFFIIANRGRMTALNPAAQLDTAAKCVILTKAATLTDATYRCTTLGTDTYCDTAGCRPMPKTDEVK